MVIERFSEREVRGDQRKTVYSENEFISIHKNSEHLWLSIEDEATECSSIELEGVH